MNTFVIWHKFIMCLYLCEIESLCKSEEGLEVLKNNARYAQTEPDIDKVRKKYGKEENDG